MSYTVTVADVEARWRPLEAAESAVATELIADAKAVLASNRPGLDAAIEAGKVSARLAVSVLCAMVTRVLRNPDALTGQAVEDISQNFAGPKYDGRLYVTDEELSTLGAGSTSSGASSVLPYAKVLARLCGY